MQPGTLARTRFAAWSREHPGESFVAGAHVSDAAPVETLVEP